MTGLILVAKETDAGPATVMEVVPVQPLASLAVMVTGPAVTPVKLPLLWNVVPFLLYV